MGGFDQACRYAAKLDPPGFFRWLVPGSDPDLTFQTWLDTRTLPFPGTPDRTCDTVAAFGSNREPARVRAMVVEFQTESDPEILDRLLEYVSRFRWEMRV